MNANKSENLGKIVHAIERFLQVGRAKNMKERPVITPETDLFEDLEIDSLEAMDLLAEIEKIFNVSIEAKEMMAKSKIADLVDYISTLQSK